MSLLLASTSGWILDIVFFVLLIAGLVLGSIRGFVRGVCKIAGTVLAVIVAFFFCSPLAGRLEDAFGLVTKLAGAIGSASVSYWLIVVLSFILLVALTRLLAFLLGKIGKKLIETSTALNVIDKILGAILGAAEALLFVLFILIIFKWIQVDALEQFIESSRVVGAFYFGDWYEWLGALSARFLQG